MSRRVYEQDNAEGKLTVDVSVTEGGDVEVFFHDIGAAAERMTGDSDYESALTIPSSDLARLTMHLLADRFADDIQAQSKIATYCEEHGIATRAWTF